VGKEWRGGGGGSTARFVDGLGAFEVMGSC